MFFLEEPDPNCKLYLPFDGVDAQTTIVDKSLSQHTVTPASGAKIQAAKIGSGCLTVDGTGDYLTVPDSDDFYYGTGPVTIEYWVKFAAEPSGGCIYFGQRVDSPTITAFYLYQESSSVVSYTCYDSNSFIGGTEFYFTPTAGTWYHMALVRNGSSIVLYINGTAASVKTVNQAISAGTSFPNIGADLWIGADAYGGGRLWVNGCMDDFHITKSAKYSGTFTPVQVVADANTKLLIKFDQADGTASTNILDSSASSHTITANGTAKVLAPKMGSGCLVLNGSSDYITIPNSSDFAYGTTPFTIQFWLKLNSASGTQFIYDHRSNADSEQYSSTLWYSGSSNYINFSGTKAPSYTVVYDYTYNITLTAGQWYHICVVRNGASLLLFLDGTLVTWSTVGTAITATTSFPTITDRDLHIGNYSGNNYFVNGCIDDFSIHNIALHTSSFTLDTNPYNITAVDRAYAYKANSVLKLHCDEDSLTDSSSNAFVLTDNNSCTFDTSAKIGNTCLSVNGSNQCISIPDNAKFDFSGQFTFEAYVYLVGSYTYIFGGNPLSSHSSTGVTVPSYYFTITPTGIQIGMCTAEHTWGIDAAFNVTISTNTWHHIAISRDASNDIRAFFNGSAVESPINNSTAFTNTNSTVGIGGVINGPSFYGDGKIDELRISDTCRYTTTFAVPGRFTSDANTILLTHFDKMPDSSDYGHTITANGTAQITTTGPKIGTGCLLLDGNSDYLSIPDSPLWSFTGDFTIEFWSLSNNTGVNEYFIGNGDLRLGSGGTDGWCLGRHSAAGGFAWLTGTHGDISGTAGTWGTNGVWHHVALVRYGMGTNNVKLYHNGIYDGAVTNTQEWTSGNALQIGKSSDDSYPYYLTGNMDEINISNYAKYLANFVPNARGAF